MDNLQRIHQVDAAWNQRDWELYGSLIADDFQGWMNGDSQPHDKAEHLHRGQAYCAAFPGNRIHYDPYLDAFASEDGKRTCTISTVTASSSTAEDQRAMLMVVCHWRDGQIVRQRESICTDPFVSS
jgi:ketosteroid isomerase-like protein